MDNAGYFRTGGVGVFSGTQAVHIAPPADRVPFLMNDLFDWLNLKYQVKTNSSYGYGWKRNLHYVLYTGKFWNSTISEAIITVHFPEVFSQEQILTETSPKNFEISSKSISWKFTNFKSTYKDNIHLQIISFPTYNKIKDYEKKFSDTSTSPELKLEIAEFYAGLAPSKGINLSAPFRFDFDYFKDTVLANSNDYEKSIIINAFKLVENDKSGNYYFVKDYEGYHANASLQKIVSGVMERIRYFEKKEYPENFRFIQRSKLLYETITASHPSNHRFWLSYVNHFYLIESRGAHPCIPWIGTREFSAKQQLVINKAYQNCSANKAIELWHKLIHPELQGLPDTIGSLGNSFTNEIPEQIEGTENTNLNSKELYVKESEDSWSIVTLSNEEFSLIREVYDITKNNFFKKSDRKILFEDKVKLIEILTKFSYYRYDFCRKIKENL